MGTEMMRCRRVESPKAISELSKSTPMTIPVNRLRRDCNSSRSDSKYTVPIA